MNKKTLVILIILTSLASIAIILGAIFGLARKGVKEEAEQPIVASTAPAVSEDIDTSHWETYRNEEFGFEFKHPSEADGLTLYSPPEYKSAGGRKLEITFELSYDDFMSEGTIFIYNGNIDDLLKNENYYTKAHWDIKTREKIALGNGLEGEKIVWSNNEAIFYIQQSNYPMTIEVTGYKNDLSELSFPPNVTEEEQNKWRIMYNTILLKIISSFKFTGN